MNDAQKRLFVELALSAKKEAKVHDEQMKYIESLQKELELAEDILERISIKGNDQKKILDAEYKIKTLKKEIKKFTNLLPY